MKLALIIPCYNERDNIPYIIERIKGTFSFRKDIDVILVDNGSTDGSESVLLSLSENIDFISYIRSDKNLGYGGGILFGLNAAGNADVYAWTHADMQCDPRDVLTAFDLLCSQESDRYVIKGKRLNRGFVDSTFTLVMQYIANLALKINISDINAQPKMFTKAFYDDYVRGVAPSDFSLDLFLLYKAQLANIDILETPVKFEDRKNGIAKGGGSWRTRVKLINRTLRYIYKLKRSTNTEVSS